MLLLTFARAQAEDSITLRIPFENSNLLIMELLPKEKIRVYLSNKPDLAEKPLPEWMKIADYEKMWAQAATVLEKEADATYLLTHESVKKCELVIHMNGKQKRFSFVADEKLPKAAEALTSLRHAMSSLSKW